MIQEIHHRQLFAAPGIDALHLSDLAEVVLQGGSVVEIVRNVLALDGCGFHRREAPKTVRALASFTLTPRSSSQKI